MSSQEVVMMKKFSRVVLVVMLILGVSVPVLFGAAAAPANRVVVYTAGPGSLSSKIAEGFEAKTGISVEMFQGTTGSVVGRLEAEQDNPHADVVVLASWPSGMELMNRGWLQQYEPVNVDLLHDGWNLDNYLFGYSASALGVTYNTDNITDPGNDWTDYVKPEFKDIVAMPDPSASGSALDFLAGYVLNFPDTAWDFFQGLRDNGLELAGANRPALNSVLTAANYLVLAGVDYMAYGDMALGNPIDIYYPESGTVVNPRPAMILKTARNMENAQKYIDYLLSDEAQQFVADLYIIPGRKDIDSHPDRVGYFDMNVFDLDWDWMAENQEDINNRFQDIFR